MAIQGFALSYLCASDEQIMPTYEYSCGECGTFASTHNSFDDDVPVMQCPKCLITMNRVYSAPALVFKGTGWGGK